MRMKFKNILVIVCSIFLGTGCNEFLDLVPEDDILTIPKIFGNEDRSSSLEE